MLINFSVEHFRSFGEEQTLNMVAADLDEHPGHCVPVPATKKSVLPVAVVYGANASGKSNLVKAIHFAQVLIQGRTTPSLVSLNRFRFTEERTPTSFEFRFLAGGRVFVYSFTIDQDAVTGERLHAMSEAGRELSVFTRHNRAIKVGTFSSLAGEAAPLRKALKALTQLGVRDDQLLLNRIVDLPDERRGSLLTSVVHWFTKSLTIIETDAEYFPLVDMLAGSDAFRTFCAAFFKNVGTGIRDIHVEATSLGAEDIPNFIIEQLQTTQGRDVSVMVNGPETAFRLDVDDPSKIVRRIVKATHSVAGKDYTIHFQDESDGTRRSANLLPAFALPSQEGSVFVVDEIDRSLHPLLCHSLLGQFLQTCPGRARQMIATTHETHLLDLDLLRRDEIWFMEKDQDQQSRLSSLVDWKPLHGLRLEAGYLQGRFGGIPFIGDTKKLMDLIRCPPEGLRDEAKAPA